MALTARDSDVIKTYVRLGLGVGIVASVAIEPASDADLVVLDASHLFPIHTTWVGFRRGTLLRNFAYDFMQLFGPHLNRQLIDQAIEARDGEGQSELFRKISLPYPLIPAVLARQRCPELKEAAHCREARRRSSPALQDNKVGGHEQHGQAGRSQHAGGDREA